MICLFLDEDRDVGAFDVILKAFFPVAGILFLRLTLVDVRSLPWSGRGWALRVGLAGGFVRLGRENLGLARMGDVRYEEDVRY